jgi:hypothetical protein
MWKFLFIILVLFAIVANADEEIKYAVSIGKKFKGILLIDNGQKDIEAKYYNINSRDRIPFYAPEKEFTLSKVSNFPTLKTLKIGNIDKSIEYNLKSTPSDILEVANIAKEDMKDSAIIFDTKNQLPSDVIEKKQIHTIESLILSIFKTKKIPTKIFYLYEPHKKMLMKVKFLKEGREKIKVGAHMCSADKWVLKLFNRNKRLIRIYVNPYPVYIEAYSHKWSFNITGVGKERKIIVVKKDLAFEKFKKDLQERYKNISLKITSQDIVKDIFDVSYVTSFTVNKKFSNADLKKSLPDYLRNADKITFAKKSKNKVTFSISKKDIYNVIKEDYKIKGDFYVVKERKMLKISELRDFFARKDGCKIDSMYLNKMICGSEKKEITAKNSLEKYLKEKYRKFNINDIESKDDNFDKIITFTLEYKKKIDNRFLSIYVMKAFKNKYKRFDLQKVHEVKKIGDKYYIDISLDAVGKYICKQTFPSLQVEYANNICLAKGIYKKKAEDVNEIVNMYLYKAYPDLKILNTKITDTGDSYKFYYLNSLRKITHACK